MRRLSALCLTASLLAPAIASAAFTAPSDVLRAAQRDASAHGFAVEVHGSAEGAYMAMWAKGQYQGSTLRDAKSTGTITVDFAQPAAGITARVRLQYAVADGTLYVLINNVDIRGESNAATLAGSLTGKRWLRIDDLAAVEQETASMGDMMGGGDMNAFIGGIADALFSQTQRSLGADTEYHLTLKPDAFDAMLRTMMAGSMGIDTTDRAAMRDMMRELRADATMGTLRAIFANLSMDYTLRMSAAGRLLRSTLNGALHIEGIDVTFSAQSSALGSPVQVTPPALTMTLDELERMIDAMGGVDSFLGMPLPDFGGTESWEQREWDDPSEDAANSDEWSWEDDATSQDACAPTDASAVAALRKGALCGATNRPHARN